jgi:cytochrome P450
MFDPHNLYAELADLRRRGAVIPYREDSVFVTRHAEILNVLSDNRHYSTSFVAESIAPATGGSTVVGLDGTPHRTLRTLLLSSFSQRQSERHARTIRALADMVVSTLARDGDGDVMDVVAAPYSTGVMAAVLGLGPLAPDVFHRWHTKMFHAFKHGVAGDEEAGELTAYFRDMVRKYASDGPSLAASLVSQPWLGRAPSDDEIAALLHFLLLAGAGTVYHAIGNVLFAFLTHPDQFEVVRSTPSVRPRALEEALRWETPVVLTVRVAKDATKVGDLTLASGTLLYLLLASANRDESRYVRASEFDVRRDFKPHLSFGHGAHACVGTGLARFELNTLLDIICERTPHLRLDPQAPTPLISGEVFRFPAALAVVT